LNRQIGASQTCLYSPLKTVIEEAWEAVHDYLTFDMYGNLEESEIHEVKITELVKIYHEKYTERNCVEVWNQNGIWKNL